MGEVGTIRSTWRRNSRSLMSRQCATQASGGQSDAVLIDEALRSFLLRHRAAQLDAEYDAYDALPLDDPDEWGDLAAFRAAAASS